MKVRGSEGPKVRGAEGPKVRGSEGPKVRRIASSGLLGVACLALWAVVGAQAPPPSAPSLKGVTFERDVERIAGLHHRSRLSGERDGAWTGIRISLA